MISMNRELKRGPSIISIFVYIDSSKNLNKYGQIEDK